jgi:hypothetical protein
LSPLPNGFQRLENEFISDGGSYNLENSSLDAVRMRLPLLLSFPLDELVFDMAAEPYLTARKTLEVYTSERKSTSKMRKVHTTGR